MLNPLTGKIEIFLKKIKRRMKKESGFVFPSKLFTRNDNIEIDRNPMVEFWFPLALQLRKVSLVFWVSFQKKLIEQMFQIKSRFGFIK